MPRASGVFSDLGSGQLYFAPRVGGSVSSLQAVEHHPLDTQSAATRPRSAQAGGRGEPCVAARNIQ